MLPDKLKFSCSTLPVINGHALKSCTPDENGCYEVIVGCIGVPTRNNVIYEPESVVEAMADVNSRFNICLRDGNLAGEYGHPRVQSKDDLERLLLIDEKLISHYFRKIWIGEKPIMISGQEAFPIRALVKPAGPYGKYLEESLRDPCINTAFSIRSICTPTSGPDSRYTYRSVQYLVTFDAVFAPGFEITSKRYAVGGNESLEMDIAGSDLLNASRKNMVAGCEGINMLTDADVRKLKHEREYRIGDNLVGVRLMGSASMVNVDGNLVSVASLCYNR